MSYISGMKDIFAVMQERNVLHKQNERHIDAKLEENWRSEAGRKISYYIVTVLSHLVMLIPVFLDSRRSFIFGKMAMVCF